jgi:lipocalin
MNNIISSILLSLWINSLNCFAVYYKPVDELNIDNYTGRWYQVYKDIGDMTFQGFGTCAIADYKLEYNTISILNSQINKDGSVNQITGTAFYDDGNSGGELTVNLDGVNNDAPYWVFDLGPVVDNEYQYSLVSDNLKFTLFVLARNVTEYYNTYDKYVLEQLNIYGFNREINKPIKMDQNNCNYNLYSNKW